MNIDRYINCLSVILSEIYGMKITVYVKGPKGENNDQGKKMEI